MKTKYICNWCGKSVYRYPSQMAGKRHYFCSRPCMWDFSSKQKNPDGYSKLKDMTAVSEHMTRLNRKMNADRMTLDVRKKLRKARLGKGENKTYEKTHGVHTHRVVAEKILGRKLRKGEVVHHVDGNYRNNHPDNLMVFKSQKEHAAWHAKLNLFFWGEVMPK